MPTSEWSARVRDAIYQRRAVRFYSPQKLEEVTIRVLLDAAVRAPTAVNAEPWMFVVIQDATLLKKLSDHAKIFFQAERQHEHLRNDPHVFDNFKRADFNIFYNASTLILISSKVLGPFVAADCWLAAQNLMLIACTMGLGTCVIGSAVSGLNSREGKALLGISNDISVIAPIVVGVPGGEMLPSSRKAPNILVWKYPNE